MKWMVCLLALLAAGPPLVAEAQGNALLDDALQKDYAAYRTLRRGLGELRYEVEGLQAALVDNRGAMADFRRINLEHTELLDKVSEVTPVLAEAYHQLVDDSGRIRVESEELRCMAAQVAQEAYAVYQAASQVHCLAAALPGQLRALNTAFEVGKLLSFALGFSVGYAVGGAGAASSSTTTTTKGGWVGGGGGGSVNPWTGGVGSVNPWTGGIGGSINPWTGGGGGFGWIGGVFSKTVTTTASTAGLSGLLALPIPLGFGGGSAGCVGGNCAPAVTTPCVGAACVQTAPCTACIEEEKKCDGSPACVERVKKECKACNQNSAEPQKPCTECEETSAPLTPIPETEVMQ